MVSCSFNTRPSTLAVFSSLRKTKCQYYLVAFKYYMEIHDEYSGIKILSIHRRIKHKEFQRHQRKFNIGS